VNNKIASLKNLTLNQSYKIFSASGASSAFPDFYHPNIFQILDVFSESVLAHLPKLFDVFVVQFCG